MEGVGTLGEARGMKGDGTGGLVLVMDTSTRYAGAGLWRGDEAVATMSWHSARNHTRELMPAIRRLLDMAGAAPADLTGLGVALGPGGFSAIRVGLSTAKGLALPLKLALVGVGTLELEAYPYAGTGLPVRPVIDAGRGEVATALFRGPLDAWRKLEDERVRTVDDMVASVSEPTLLCGEGVPSRCSQLVEALGDRAVPVDGYTPATRLWSLGAIARYRLDRGDSDDPDTLQPMYLRRPSIGRPRDPRRIRH